MRAKGTLIAIGGNEQKEFTKIDEKFHSDFGEGIILHHILDQAAGSNTCIEVITSASNIPMAVGKKYKKTFAGLGADNVRILDIQDRNTAEDSNVLKRIEAADVVMFSGGNQSRISHILKGTKAHELICDRYRHDNFIVTGTSAGAVVMSEEMIAGGMNNNTLRKGDLKMGRGLGLLPEVIFDSHFIRRGRFGRLAEAVAKYPHKLGIGLGEDTGLIITEGNVCKIIGTGMVILFDGCHLQNDSYDDLKKNGRISLANLTVHILASQDKYYIREKRAEIYYNPRSHKKELSEF